MDNTNTFQKLPDIADRINRALAAGKTVRALEKQRRTPLCGVSVQNDVLTGFVRKSDDPRQAWIVDLSRSRIVIGDFTVDEILYEPLKAMRESGQDL